MYEQKIREAFPQEYAERDTETAKVPTKMESSDMIGYLTSSIMDLSRLRTNLFSRVRNNDIRKQAREFFGTDEVFEELEADCPWDYPNQFYNGSTHGKYKGMTDEQLYALPVEGLQFLEAGD
jgi:hypothetical protein